MIHFKANIHLVYHYGKKMNVLDSKKKYLAN
jgi:hypothetical protein